MERKGLTDYAMMLAAGPVNKFAIDWPDANTLFQQGRAAFFIDASLFGPGYEDPDQSLVAGKTGYMVMPPQEAGANSQTGHWLWGLGIPKNAPNKDAGWYFIQYMTNPANTAVLGTYSGGAPRRGQPPARGDQRDNAFVGLADLQCRQGIGQPFTV